MLHNSERERFLLRVLMSLSVIASERQPRHNLCRGRIKPLPVKRLLSLLSPFPSLSFCLRRVARNNPGEQRLRCLPAVEHLMRSSGAGGGQSGRAGPGFDRWLLLLESSTSSALHNCAARTGLFRTPAEPSEYLITWAEHVTAGVTGIMVQ